MLALSKSLRIWIALGSGGLEIHFVAIGDGGVQESPGTRFENKLKRITRRGDLNCGHCESTHGNKCSGGPHCSKWYLHKFRHTFATTNLEHGVSIRTVQEWLGHSDLESTMVYRKLVRHKDIQKLLDTSQMADLAAESLGLKSVPVPGGTVVQPTEVSCLRLRNLGFSKGNAKFD